MIRMSMLGPSFPSVQKYLRGEEPCEGVPKFTIDVSLRVGDGRRTTQDTHEFCHSSLTIFFTTKWRTTRYYGAYSLARAPFLLVSLG